MIPASGADAQVGGSTARLLDLADLTGKRLPPIIGVVVGLSMLLLLIAFRSAVAPLQAVIDGLAGTGKVIASAAAIMVSVFPSFIINGDPTVKEFGGSPAPPTGSPAPSQPTTPSKPTSTRPSSTAPSMT